MTKHGVDTKTMHANDREWRWGWICWGWVLGLGCGVGVGVGDGCYHQHENQVLDLLMVILSGTFNTGDDT